MSAQSTEVKVYTLKSRCPKCGEVSTIQYSHGIEKHECSQHHFWEKSPTSTTAAIMGLIQGLSL